MTVAVVDVESTGLDSSRHQVWEIGIITDGYEFEAHLPVDLTLADPTGLRIGRFYERRRKVSHMSNPAKICRCRWDPDKDWSTSSPNEIAEYVAVMLDGKHMVGAVPDFDSRFLTRFLNDHGQAATWNYHLVDIEALAAGFLGQAPPWNSNDLSRAVGVDPDDFDRHTALADARWAKAVYEAVLNR